MLRWCRAVSGRQLGAESRALLHTRCRAWLPVNAPCVFLPHMLQVRAAAAAALRARSPASPHHRVPP